MPGRRAFRVYRVSVVILGQKAIQAVKALRGISGLRGRQDPLGRQGLWGHREMLGFRGLGVFQVPLELREQLALWDRKA